MTDVAAIRMIVFDVDGVLTDGRIVLDSHGVESKQFHVRDGLGVRLAKLAGLKVGILTGRSTQAVQLRMAEMGVSLVMQGCDTKGEGLEELCRQAGVQPGETAYLGDDLLDLPALRRCGYAMAVADAAAEVRAIARHVTVAAGGQGAAREAVEHLLKQQGRWESAVAALDD